jgi:hypothetical protein
MILKAMMLQTCPCGFADKTKIAGLAPAKGVFFSRPAIILNMPKSDVAGYRTGAAAGFTERLTSAGPCSISGV